MILTLQRGTLLEDRTLGEFLLDGRHFAWTLEDKMREVHEADGSWIWHSGLKVPGETAIPAGVYEIVVTYSNRFGRPLPLVLGVPDFEGVRLHGGNRPDQTDGCPLLGLDKDDTRIWNCARPINDLTVLIRNETALGKVFLEVRNQ